MVCGVEVATISYLDGLLPLCLSAPTHIFISPTSAQSPHWCGSYQGIDYRPPGGVGSEDEKLCLPGKRLFVCSSHMGSALHQWVGDKFAAGDKTAPSLSSFRNSRPKACRVFFWRQKHRNAVLSSPPEERQQAVDRLVVDEVCLWRTGQPGHLWNSFCPEHSPFLQQLPPEGHLCPFRRMGPDTFRTMSLRVMNSQGSPWRSLTLSVGFQYFWKLGAKLIAIMVQ